MGVLQKAVQTYDAWQNGNWIISENHEPMAPIAHMTVRPTYIVTIDSNGNFQSVERYKKDGLKIPIPVTEESSGRANSPAPHGLCDNLGYVSNYFDTKKYGLYCNQLKEWIEFDPKQPKLEAIYEYVCSGTIIDDVKNFLEIDDISGEDKSTIAWIVNGTEASFSEVWKDKELFESFKNFYLYKISAGKRDVCYIEGSNQLSAAQHLKGVFSKSGNAKIISANDSTNFTFKGRFIDSDEAVTVGYIASQKAHNALKWILSNFSDVKGSRAFVCWNPNGKTVPKVTNNLLLRGDSNERLNFADYKAKLNGVLSGYRTNLPEGENIVIAAFDAATTGRLSISYYNEINGSDFLDRIKYWDETCCWDSGFYGVEGPSLYEIIKFAFGTKRDTNNVAYLDVDEKIIGEQMQRLIHCRVDKAKFPVDIMKALVVKAGNLQIYDAKIRNRLLFVSCAAIRKFRIDKFGLEEDKEMALDPERKDRSYQYGRLLALLEKAEKDTFDKDEKRETNAIRMQSVFVQRPAYAVKIITEQVKKASYPRLSIGARMFYEKEIGKIWEILSDFPEHEINKPLSETYLLGYYLQKNIMYTSNKNNINEDNQEDLENE